MESLLSQLERPDVQRALLAIAVTAIVATLLFVLKWLIEKKLRPYIEQSESSFARILPEMLRKIPKLTLIVFALYAGVQVLGLPPKAELRVQQVVVFVSLFQVGMWGSLAIKLWFERGSNGAASFDPGRATAVRALAFVAQTLLWAAVLLVLLDNLGVNVTALVAGLGVGGIAVALAVQSVLGDLLASVAIILDKPFVVGDSLAIGEFTGTVESVGVKTTRLRSLTGEQLIFSNADLLQSRIRNFKRMIERRVAFTVGVTFETPITTLREIPAIFEAAIREQPQTRFERAHLKQFGASSIDFEVVYWALTADFKLHMDILQAVNLRIAEEFASRKIDFAFPTQTVHVASMPVQSQV